MVAFFYKFGRNMNYINKIDRFTSKGTGRISLRLYYDTDLIGYENTSKLYKTDVTLNVDAITQKTNEVKPDIL